MLKSGLYEQVINETIAKELQQNDRLKKIEPIDSAEASKILSKYLLEIIETGLNHAKEKTGDISGQVLFANKLVDVIRTEIQEDVFDGFFIDENAEQLLALLDKTNSIYSLNEKAEIIRPETSISVSSLFTGAIHEPSMFSELKKEILSSDRIDMLVSFIKWSGLRLIIEELRSFTQRGGFLCVITTSYMGATDVKAIDELNLLLNTQIKISYDNGVTVATGNEDGSITVAGAASEPDGNLIEAEIGFPEKYAFVQHEHTEFNHPMGGQAKYVESVVVESEQRWTNHLAESAKKGLRGEDV